MLSRLYTLFSVFFSLWRQSNRSSRIYVRVLFLFSAAAIVWGVASFRPDDSRISAAGSSVTISLSTSANPTVYGQPVLFTATVRKSAPGGERPKGRVIFSDGSRVIGAATLNPLGKATFTTANFPVGIYRISAKYTGDSQYGPKISQTINQMVDKASTSVAIASAINPTVYGQPVVLTAQVASVAPGGGTPTGTVEFKADGTTIGTPVNLSNAGASVSISSLLVGTHIVTAEYKGDDNFKGSGNTLAGGQFVNKADTVITVAASVNPSVYGQPVIFTAAVTAVAPGAGMPTGLIQFKADGALLGGRIVLANGSAIAFKKMFFEKLLN